MIRGSIRMEEIKCRMESCDAPMCGTGRDKDQEVEGSLDDKFSSFPE